MTLEPSAHTEGVIKSGSPRSSPPVTMAMQSHRGGPVEVMKTTATATNYSGVGSSQRARDFPVAGMPVDDYVGTGRQRDFAAVGMPVDPNCPSRQKAAMLKT